MESWLDSVLSKDGEAPNCSQRSADKEEWVQNVVTAESLIQKGFQEFVSTVRTVRTDFESPRNTAGTEGEIRVAIPADLTELVAEVARLEGWPQDELAEHSAIIGRQLASGECDAATIRTSYRAHIARWHDTREAIEERAAIMEYDGGLPRAEAERLAGQVNDCMTCRYWQGVQTYHDPRYKALTSAGVVAKPKSLLMGACAKHQRPWRVSNIPGDADYNRWHLVGQCGYCKGMDWEQAA